jgi:hypothetical protein
MRSGVAKLSVRADQDMPAVEGGGRGSAVHREAEFGVAGRMRARRLNGRGGGGLTRRRLGREVVAEGEEGWALRKECGREQWRPRQGIFFVEERSSKEGRR